VQRKVGRVGERGRGVGVKSRGLGWTGEGSCGGRWEGKVWESVGSVGLRWGGGGEGRVGEWGEEWCRKGRRGRGRGIGGRRLPTSLRFFIVAHAPDSSD